MSNQKFDKPLNVRISREINTEIKTFLSKTNNKEIFQNKSTLVRSALLRLVKNRY